MYINIENILQQDFLNFYQLTQDRTIDTAYPNECNEIRNLFFNIRDIVDVWNAVFDNNSVFNDYYVLLLSLFEQINYKRFWGYYQQQEIQTNNTIAIINGTYRNRFTDKLDDICRYQSLNRNEYTLIEYKRCNFKTYTELLETYRTRKLIIYMSRGSYFVVDRNILVINTDFINENQNENLKNLILSIIINNLIEEKALTKEKLIKYKTAVKDINLKDLSATINNVTSVLSNLLDENYQLEQKQQELINKHRDLKNKQIQILIEQTLKSRIKVETDTVEAQLREIESKYKTLLENKFNLQCKNLGITEMVNNCYTKLTRYLDSQIDNTLTTYTLTVESGNILNINLYTKWLPLIFIDKTMAQTAINNGIFTDTIAEKLQEYIDGKCMFYVTPIKLVIRIKLLNNTLDTFKALNSSMLPQVNNGHIEYHCLGSFNLEITKAIFDMNLAKATALFIQYLQSVAPTDTAGQKAIRNCCVVDENMNIVFSAYDMNNGTQRFTNHNLNDYDYKEGGWKENANNQNN